MHEATFLDGPLEGESYTIRSTSGVLAADKPADLFWVYVPAEDPGSYRVAFGDDADPSSGARPYDETALIASVEAGWDVLVATPDDPDEDEINVEVVITDGE